MLFFLLFVCVWLSVQVADAQAPISSLTEAALQSKNLRIVSANSRYEGLCIQDSSLTANKTNYKFIVTSYKSNTYRQRWKLINSDGADTSSYYLRNYYTSKYLSAQSNLYKGTLGSFYLPTAASSFSNNTLWTFTRLSNGQYVISSLDEYGLRRYLAPCDSTKLPQSFGTIERAENTVFAWYLYDANTNLTGVDAVEPDASVGVGVVDGRVVVAGTSEYKIFDTSGRRISTIGRLPAGVYIVVAGKKSYKVMVK